MYAQVVQCLVAKVSKSYVSRHWYDLVSKRSDKLFVSNHQEMNNVDHGFLSKGGLADPFHSPT
jgi:hypothetical protein